MLDFRPIERPLRALETLEHEKKAHEIPPPGKTKPETAARNEERTRRWRRRRPCDPRAARRRPVAGAGGGAKEAGPVADWSPSVERSPPLAALAAAVAIGRDSSSDPPLSFDRPVFFFFFRHSAFRSIQNDVIQLEGTWAHLLFSAGVGQVSVSLATFSVDVSFFFFIFDRLILLPVPSFVRFGRRRRRRGGGGGGGVVVSIGSSRISGNGAILKIYFQNGSTLPSKKPNLEKKNECHVIGRRQWRRFLSTG